MYVHMPRKSAYQWAHYIPDFSNLPPVLPVLHTVVADLMTFLKTKQNMMMTK